MPRPSISATTIPRLRWNRGRPYVQIGQYHGLRIWLAYWFLRGVSQEITQLRREVETMRRQIADGVAGEVDRHVTVWFRAHSALLRGENAPTVD